MTESFWIGIDDTDSPEGMCTTWLSTLLCQCLLKQGFSITESRLVRLNPTIPYKTRGNAAIALHFSGDPQYAFDVACSLVEKYAQIDCAKTNPGVVVFRDKPDSSFYFKAVTDVCTIDEAKSILMSALFFKGYKNCRGLIGATAAVASDLEDYTWECLIYRKLEKCGTPRFVDPESVIRCEDITSPTTWDSYDRENNSIVCVPHGPDPVLIGIRGESPFAVAYASSFLITEPTAFFKIWKTNQGTDSHLLFGTAGNLSEYHSYIVDGSVKEVITGVGGHVRLLIQDMKTYKELVCMAYEPSHGFRNIIRALIPGDEVTVVGSYLKNTLNLEKIRVNHLSEDVIIKAPICPNCGYRMTSAGKNKGYKCRRCDGRSNDPEIVRKGREVVIGWYEVPPSARRHLAKPLVRG